MARLGGGRPHEAEREADEERGRPEEERFLHGRLPTLGLHRHGRARDMVATMIPALSPSAECRASVPRRPRRLPAQAVARGLDQRLQLVLDEGAFHLEEHARALLRPAPKARPEEPRERGGPPHAGEDRGNDITVRAASRSAVFWVLAVALAIPAMLATGMMFHQISFFEGQGLSAQDAANIFAVSAVSMVVFMPVFGLLLDRFDTRAVVSAGILLMAVAMWAMSIATTPALAALYGIALGAATGATITNAAYVWPRFYGRTHLGGIQGMAHSVTIIGTSLGPLPFGLAYDALGSYREVLLALALLPIAFGVAVPFIRPPK